MDPEPLAPRLLSQREAAVYLGISYWMLRELNWSGALPHVRINRRILIDRVDLDAYVQRTKIRHGT